MSAKSREEHTARNRASQATGAAWIGRKPVKSDPADLSVVEGQHTKGPRT